jgi:hypothetical protein
MIVLFWSRATRDRLESFGWGIAALHRFDAATKLPFLAARPIASIGTRKDDYKLPFRYRFATASRSPPYRLLFSERYSLLRGGDLEFESISLQQGVVRTIGSSAVEPYIPVAQACLKPRASANLSPEQYARADDAPHEPRERVMRVGGGS